MEFHDSYARTTPFELAFPDAEVAHALWAAIEEEAESRGVDPLDRAAFVMLGSVGAFLRRLQGPDAPAEAIHSYGALVFHAYHFSRAGHRLLVLSTPLSRALTEPERAFDGPISPEDAGYAQLPRNLFWAHPAPDAPPEPVDGFFWALSPGGVLQTLLVVGMREGRPGLAVVAVPEAPWEDAHQWMDTQVREGGTDFETTLPGGDLGELYSFERAGEVLKLVARFFGYLDSSIQPMTLREPGHSDPDGPEASIHPFVRVGLHA